MSNIVASFNPFKNHLDFDRTLNLVNDALDGANDGELFLEEAKSESLMLDDRKLRNATFNSSKGFGLRAVNGETIGYAHSSNLTEEALKHAVSTVRLAINNPAEKAPPPKKNRQNQSNRMLF